MPASRIAAIADRYWAGHLGCPVEALFAEPLQIAPNGSELAGYGGVFALFRGGAAMVSISPDRADMVRGLLSNQCDECSPIDVSNALRPVASAVVGPAFIGYAESVPPPCRDVRELNQEDAAAVEALREACNPTQWEHGGSSLESPCCGAFVEGNLAALAGYEVWGETIAHISVVTHPGWRGKGLGKAVVAGLAWRAIQHGLLPQYRTLESNTGSIRIAEALGFQRYAVSIAVRLSDC